MKKILISSFAACLFFTCCLFGITAYAETSNDISNAKVELSASSYIYSGEKKTPAVTVTVTALDDFQQETSFVLKKDVDYSVKYTNNVNVGTATVTVTGKGNYIGSVKKTYKITPLSFKSKSIKVKTTKKATPGSAPTFSVTYKSKKLVKNKDYTISYKNYDKTGVERATVTIKGKGNFSSARTFKAHVYPKKVTSVYSNNRTTSSFELHWASQKKYAVSGYKIYSCNKKGNNQKLLKTVTTNKVKLTNLTPGKYYYYKIRAYKKNSSGKTIYGDYCNVYLTCSKPSKTSINAISKSTKKKKITVRWKQQGCTGYEIQYTTDKSFKKGVKKVVVIGKSKTSKSISISNTKKTYYARVRAFRRYNGKKTYVYGPWSVKLSSSYSKLYASYTTNYVNNPDRTTNLKLASKAINGTILYPGETFSFNKTVGQRTKAKGYKDAYIFTGASSHTMGTGGGICQVASTMFNTTLIANLGIVERHQHSQRVTYCPLGRDAAIYWGSYDYRFKNTTEYPIKIVMSCANGKLTCSFYTCMNVSHKKVSLKVTQNGKNFTLRRYVGGYVNYTAYSTY